MKKLWLAMAVMLMVAALGTSNARANLLLNGSFEDYSVTEFNGSVYPWMVRSFYSTPNWTQFGDGVDLNHNNYTQLAPGFEVLVKAQEGVNYLDMNQGGSLGGIEQVVAATPGTSYRLTLYTTAWAKNAITGKIGYELYDPSSNNILAGGEYTDNVGGTWIFQSLEAVAASNQIGVRIQGLYAYQAGMGLDNVSLNAVPLPGAVWLLGSGLLGLTGWRRLRKG